MLWDPLFIFNVLMSSLQWLSFKTGTDSSRKCSYSERNKHSNDKLTMSSHHGSPYSSAYPHDEYDFDDDNNDDDLEEERDNDDQDESDEGKIVHYNRVNMKIANTWSVCTNRSPAVVAGFHNLNYRVMLGGQQSIN